MVRLASSWRRLRRILAGHGAMIVAATWLVACAPREVAAPLPAIATPLTPFPPISMSPVVAPPTATATPALAPVTWALEPGLPERHAVPLLTALSQHAVISIGAVKRPLQMAVQAESASARLKLVPLAAAPNSIAERFYAVVVPFATVADDVSLAEVQARWQGAGVGPLYVTEEAADDLPAVLGPRKAQAVSADELLTRLISEPNALGIMPFDQLDPRYKVLTVDGINVLSNQLDPSTYSLAVALTAEGTDGTWLASLLRGAIQPVTNRDPHRLTTLIMTGVTAMARGTAEKMEQKGYTYPAEVISATLRAADITHVSNEVPFIKGCVVNNTYMNLILCSDYPYWAALEAIGTDIVGLSGNHVNDFGREGARESLQFYRDHGIPVYGSGLNVEEACAPLRWEHNGNRFAFLAALAFEPRSAWATETEPGACYFYDNHDQIVATIRDLSQKVDIVSIELQYLETYNPFPTPQQVTEFRALRAAGADIVTGVQSHVPQAMEPYGADDPGGPGIIVYGLGNLFFDQMWSWETRTGLIARHTVYQGRLISTEILTTVLEDYAQPRWATPEERAEILRRIFAAVPERP
ncbi:MAG: CapA family protein [Anaerolineae bacterium]|nr:CapA family protein [Anaerolineae bacterium]MDW8097919.1 CapA family protein [Anaerolineae bacterium]